jgi:hypothetical protein
VLYPGAALCDFEVAVEERLKKAALRTKVAP